MIISHNSALEWFRGHPISQQQASRTTRCITIPNSVGYKGRANSSNNQLNRLGILRMPAHLLVGRNVHSSRSSTRVFHKTCLCEAPRGSLFEIEEDLYVCAPELLFVQMASQLGFLATVVLGYELCGSYSHYPSLISGFYKRPPLTSVATIRNFLSTLGPLRGKARAAKALDYVLDNSASPMETVVACSMVMPENEGGLGFTKPILNYEVSFDTASRALTQTSCARIDIAWPEHCFGFEYDSDQFHNNPAKDRRRREALMSEGWNICTIDTSQLVHRNEFEATISMALEMAPLRLGRNKPNQKDTEFLLSRLKTLTRVGLGQEAVLFREPVSRGQVEYLVG